MACDDTDGTAGSLINIDPDNLGSDTILGQCHLGNGVFKALCDISCENHETIEMGKYAGDARFSTLANEETDIGWADIAWENYEDLGLLMVTGCTMINFTRTPRSTVA